jgi:hypothetical protein
VEKGEPTLFYRLRRNINYFRFHRQIGRLLDTPPLEQRPGPVTIVSMVAGYDVRLYILAVKALYRRLGRGKIAAVVASDVSASAKRLIVEHLGPVEFVDRDSVDVGKCQPGGTWERLMHCVDRSATEYVIQIDADVLCTGPIPEVLESVEKNRAFTLADGIPKKPLGAWVDDAIARKNDNIVFEFEKRAPGFPDAARWLYLRGSSGFAGFAKGAIDRKFVEEFYAGALRLLGDRWKEWGTEQIASNFAIANSPDSIPLPKPKYLTWERHPIPEEISLLHFLGYCRFDNGVFAQFANREIDALLLKSSAHTV